jgi:predicted nucleotidyltransferase
MHQGNLRDGDAVATSHGFIFYIFGYDHPYEGYNAFLKYVPKEHAHLFNLNWLDVRWSLKGSTLLRPTELYTPEGYPALIEDFRRSFPEYLSFSPQLDRWMITVPRKHIEEVFTPSRQLMLIIRRGAKDPLEDKALSLIQTLSRVSSIPRGFFGIHGSISLGMHHRGSDIDVSVYGGGNFRLVRKALIGLEADGVLTLKRGTRWDRKRLNRGIFEDVDFVVNATRRFSEITNIKRVIRLLHTVEVECRCVSAHEAMYRPAVYKVEECRVLYGSDPTVRELSRVVSMIGLYRDVVREGELMRARGVLEEVTGEPDSKHLRLVVGSGSTGEYIDWLES